MVRFLSSGCKALLAAILASILGLASLASVSATVFDRGHYEGEDAWTYTDCGPTIDVSAEFGGVYRVRTGKHADLTAFFVADNYWYREVHRRVDGKTAVIEGNGLYNETKATHVDGTTFEFRTVNAGAPFSFTDGDGNVLLRDRGAITASFTFDTLGDDVPGGEFGALVDVQLHGLFPGFDADLCEYWATF